MVHSWRSRSPLWRVLIGAACALLATGLRELLDPFVNDQIVFAVFTAAVIPATLLGSVAGGISSILASAVLADYFFLDPRYTVSFTRPKDLAAVSLFALVSAVIVSIVERWAQADEAREAVTRFRLAVFDTLATHVCVLDQLGTIIDVNQSWRDFAEANGVAADRVSTGVNYYAVCDGVTGTDAETAHRCADGLRAVADGSLREFVLEYSCHGPNEERWFELHATRFLEGTDVRVVVAHKNITTRTQAELALRHSKEQLQQAQKMESVGRLAGGVAHDFNNMLGVILGHAELALRSPLPETVKEHLDQIHSAAQRSAELTQQLLAFARKQAVRPQRLDLNRAIGGTIKMLTRLIGEQVELRWVPGESLWPVEIDPSQLNQVLANLAVNARDAIAGVGELSIETMNASIDEHFCARHAGVQPGDYVVLSVSDTGAGMSADTVDRAFEPFFTTKGTGTGLGLATVYGIVKQNNGFAHIYSEPGVGTTIKIGLPRLRGDGGDFHERQAAAAAQGGTGTVLVVEDSPAVRQMATAMLRQLGYHPIVADSPARAIAIVEEFTGTIDILLTDVVMPEMNGRELQQRIGVIKPGIKCLFMSGYTADVIAHHGVLDPGVCFLQKPFSLASLSRGLAEAMRGCS